MASLKDITGMRFGRLVVLRCSGRGHKGEALWECDCDCGRSIITYGSALRSGKTKSCGCLQIETGKSRVGLLHMEYGSAARTHGESRTRLYRIWAGMLQRCSNPKRDAYQYYGGRGIKVCERWLDYNNFRSDMLPTYFDGASIDRIDNNKDYSPQNCRWVPIKSQFSNRRNKVRVHINGEELTVQRASELTGLSKSAIYKRLRKGAIS